MAIRDEPWPQGTPCWIDCQVDDLAGAREFYSALFGWQVVDSPPEAGGYLMATLEGRPAAGIGPKPQGTSTPSAWTTYFAANSADEIAERVSAAQGRPLMPPFDVLDIGRMLVAADPGGAGFGIWQAGSHGGAGVYNQHGAYCWNELHTQDYRQAQAFYASVFDWSYTEIGDGESFVYSTFALPGETGPSGGINDATKTGAGLPSSWLTWFQVDDTDAAVATASDLGAGVVVPVRDSPVGRSATLRAPQGEHFGVIDPSRVVGRL